MEKSERFGAEGEKAATGLSWWNAAFGVRRAIVTQQHPSINQSSRQAIYLRSFSSSSRDCVARRHPTDAQRSAALNPSILQLPPTRGRGRDAHPSSSPFESGLCCSASDTSARCATFPCGLTRGAEARGERPRIRSRSSRPHASANP